jgi:pimeloyl-ACP methyl ester carboxylesterase
MSYENWRQREIVNIVKSNIGRFIQNYDHDKPTIVLLPGGMGSQLDRSQRHYRHDPMPPSRFHTVWADTGIVFGDAYDLKIMENGRDDDDHLVVANGELGKIITAYDGTREHFTGLSADTNYIVFGYDWRRPLSECADYLQQFLIELRCAIADAASVSEESALEKVTLMAHSQGGLVSKMCLNSLVDQGEDVAKWMKALVTVGTPFYGTWSQQRRYFSGEPALAPFYPPRPMARLIASLPGPYILMFPPKQIVERIGGAIGLSRYPMRELDNFDMDGEDPYDLDTIGFNFPGWVSDGHLARAGSVYNQIARELPDDVTARIFNIRATIDNDADDKKMPVELAWTLLDNEFDADDSDDPFDYPDDEEPVVPVAPSVVTRGNGDGTVPAWSAFHTSVPTENRLSLPENDQTQNHTFLAEDSVVLGKVTAIAHGRPFADAPPAAIVSDTSSASPGEVLRTMEELLSDRADSDDPRLQEKRFWRGLYKQLIA